MITLNRLKLSGLARFSVALTLVTLTKCVAAKATNSLFDQSLPSGFNGDNVIAIRDLLSSGNGTRDPNGKAQERLRRSPLRNRSSFTCPSPHANSGNPSDLNFVVPLTGGVHYNRVKRILRVNEDFSTESVPNELVIRNIVSGPDGRKLTVATDAKRNGFIQNNETIALDVQGEHAKTSVVGSLKVSGEAFDRAEGHLAVLFVVRLVQPCLSDSLIHTDPTEDQPTDITTRMSVVHASVKSIWLFDQDNGIPLGKKLHLSR